jgi:hypothetical protein
MEENIFMLEEHAFSNPSPFLTDNEVHLNSNEVFDD